MNLLETSPAQPLVMALGWALIHFTWQGALVALVLACVLRVSRRQSANARYAAACAAMLLMPALPLVTMAIIGLSTPGRVAGTLSPAVAAPPESRRLVAGVGPAGAPTQAGPGAARPQPWPSGWSQRLAPSFPWMALAWLSGVIFFSLRLISGWLYTRRLRRQGNRLLAEEWQGALRRLGGQLRVGRAVRLLESASLKAPASIGWLRPVILLPIGAVAGLTPQHLEAIIAHELAHIRRHDYLVNLLQSVIETLLFYHPAVWWVSRRMRQEREYCCDDLAVAACGDVLGYARALLEMEELRAAGPQLAVAANGGVLMNRIQRLIGAQPQPTNHYAGLFAGILVITGVLCVGVGAQILLPPLRSESTRERTVSARKGEAGQADTVAAAPAEAAGAAAGRPARVDQDDAAEALLPALRHSSWEVRKAAVEKLARFRGTRTVDLLLDALNDDHRQVREQAVTVLGAREDERLAEYLAAALTDGDWQVREQAAIALGRRGDGRAVEPLLKALVDSEWAVREQAARSLGGIGGEPAVEPLIHALRDQHEQVREAAAKSLGAAGDRRAVEPLRQALEDVSEQVRKKAAEALGSLKQSSGGASPGAPRQPSAAPEQQATQPAVAAESLRALSSSSPAERAAAACSLGRLGAVEAIPALVHLLGDDALTEPLNCWGEGHWSPARQTFKQASPGEQAAIALAALGQSAVEPLVVALSSNDPGVRRNAAWAIGEIRGGSRTNRSAAVEPLIAALRDADLWVRVAAAFSLGELRPPRATEALIMALGDAEWNAREMAAWALGEMKARPGVESLTALLLRDGDGRVRRQAAWALGEIRDPQALDSLTAALTDEDQRVRATARWAIAEIRD